MLAKRLFDLILTIPGIVLLSPLMAAITLWVALGSPGPVFFRQIRIGLHGKPFHVFKFRTMISDAEKRGLKVTVGNDPRITRAGLFLRKYKLDELPQLFNVLRGEMSLVGPRPEVPEYVDYYPDDIRKEVLSVLPGLTDNAAIEFKDENDMLAGSEDPQKTYVEEILPVKLELYLRYVRNQSIPGDTWLIFRTIFSILR